MPDLEYSWNRKHESAKEVFNLFDADILSEEFSSIEEWIDFIDVIRDSEPRFLIQIDFPNSYVEDFNKIVSIIEYELDVYYLDASLDILREQIGKFEAIERTLETIKKFPFHNKRFIIDTQNKVTDELDRLNRKVELLQQEDEIENAFESSTPKKNELINIEDLFNDL
jgi:prefoldin subunit 5